MHSEHKTPRSDEVSVAQVLRIESFKQRSHKHFDRFKVRKNSFENI